MTNEAVRYYDTYRRTLLDMHIPDWDQQFLSEYEPEKVADLYVSANISGALFYCKSHMGLNYWPAPVESGHGVYSRALDPLIAEAVHPESHLAHGFVPEVASRAPLRMPRLSTELGGQPLARLTLPYAYPSAGSMLAHDFASIHSSPPWQDLDNPTIVSNRYGDGRAVYSALPIETGRGDADQRVFTSLVRWLLGGPQTLAADAHPDVWVTAFEQPEQNRAVISVLGYFIDAPIQFPVSLSYRNRDGRRCVALRDASSGSAVPFEADEDGTVRVAIDAVDGFGMYLVIYD